MALRPRRMLAYMLVAVVFAATLAPAVVLAQTASAQELKELRQMVQQQQQRLGQLERSSRETDDLRKKIDAISNRLASDMGGVALPDWVKRTTIKGDFRYRHEMTDDDRPGRNTDRNRQRIRVRLGFFHKVNDEVDVGIQLASGDSNTPTSRNDTMGSAAAFGAPAHAPLDANGFSSKPIWLDLAYFDYHPNSIQGLHILGGKIKNVFTKPVGNSDLIWDNDVRPEGLAATYSAEVAEGVTFFAQGGGFWVTENRRPADQGLFMAQAGWKLALPGIEGGYLKMGGSYFDYTNVEGNPVVIAANGNQAAGGLYLDDYNIYEGFGELGMMVGDILVRVFGDGVHNVGASDNQSAWLVGAGLGKCKKKGDWEVIYNYRTIDQNAILGTLADADQLQGGVNGQVHKVAVAYQIAKRWKASVTYFNSKRGKATFGGARLKLYQFDLSFKF